MINIQGPNTSVEFKDVKSTVDEYVETFTSAAKRKSLQDEFITGLLSYIWDSFNELQDAYAFASASKMDTADGTRYGILLGDTEFKILYTKSEIAHNILFPSVRIHIPTNIDETVERTLRRTIIGFMDEVAAETARILVKIKEAE